MSSAFPGHQSRDPGMSGADEMPAAWQRDGGAPWRGWRGFAAVVAKAAEAGGVALVRLDVLDLADIEDTYGARTVALLLAATEARLAECARPGGGTIGDGQGRFAVCLAGPRGTEELARAAEVLCAAAMAPTTVLGRTLRLAACAGAAAAEGDENGATALRARAECALAVARRAGAGAQRQFSVAMRDDARARTVLRQALQQAVAERHFRLHYQPVVRMADRAVVGAEALARWEHAELGAQSPARFIPAAEETGLIVTLGDQVLRQALAQARAWRASGTGAPRVAVNVSGMQLRRADFVAMVRCALAEAALPAESLEIELTEGALIESHPATLAMLAELSHMGVTLALDDFGTGYSSLRYLRDLPVQVLKIDQAFIRHVATDSRDAAIVAAIIAMARGLGLATTAEGVQTEAQFAALRQMGCDAAQGWLFGAPMPPEVFAAAA